MMTQWKISALNSLQVQFERSTGMWEGTGEGNTLQNVSI